MKTETQMKRWAAAEYRIAIKWLQRSHDMTYTKRECLEIFYSGMKCYQSLSQQYLQKSIEEAI